MILPALALTLNLAAPGPVLAARDDVILIDMRRAEETMFVGYAITTKANSPFKRIDPARMFNAETTAHETEPNHGCIRAVTQHARRGRG